MAEGQKIAETKQDEAVASKGNNQPYLLQKSELEAEERQKYELEVRQRLQELDGEAETHEMAAEIDQQHLAVTKTRQESRGVEQSQEIDT